MQRARASSSGVRHDLANRGTRASSARVARTLPAPPSSSATKICATCSGVLPSARTASGAPCRSSRWRSTRANPRSRYGSSESRSSASSGSPSRRERPRAFREDRLGARPQGDSKVGAWEPRPPRSRSAARSPARGRGAAARRGALHRRSRPRRKHAARRRAALAVRARTDHESRSNACARAARGRRRPHRSGRGRALPPVPGRYRLPIPHYAAAHETTRYVGSPSPWSSPATATSPRTRSS